MIPCRRYRVVVVGTVDGVFAPIPGAIFRTRRAALRFIRRMRAHHSHANRWEIREL